MFTPIVPPGSRLLYTWRVRALLVISLVAFSTVVCRTDLIVPLSDRCLPLIDGGAIDGFGVSIPIFKSTELKDNM